MSVTINGITISKSDKESSNYGVKVSTLQEQCEAGDGEACFKLANCYNYGDGVGQSKAMYRRCLEEASKHGCKSADSALEAHGWKK